MKPVEFANVLLWAGRRDLLIHGGPNAFAVFDRMSRYRYLLGRTWQAGRTCAFVMLNPSTADHEVLDPTIRRCLHFVDEWNAKLPESGKFGTLLVGNLFAYRSRDPSKLRTVVDAVGTENDGALREIASLSAWIVVAWGDLGTLQNRSVTADPLIRSVKDVEVYCLGTNQSGEPRHPLYLPSGTSVKTYPPRYTIVPCAEVGEPTERDRETIQRYVGQRRFVQPSGRVQETSAQEDR